MLDARSHERNHCAMHGQGHLCWVNVAVVIHTVILPGWSMWVGRP